MLWLARLNAFHLDASFLGTVLQGCTDVLRAVVATNHLGFASPRDDLFQGPDHALTGQREVHLNTQCLVVEVIDHVEQAQIAAVLQPVVHEVHGPDLIDRLRHDQWLWLLTHQALARLDAKVELQLAVDAVHPFVVPAKVLHVEQVQVAQDESPVPMVVRQTHPKILVYMGVIKVRPIIYTLVKLLHL